MTENSLHQQDADLEIISKIVPYLHSKTFIDIGAEKGTFAASLIQQNLTGVLFEPLEKHENELKNLVKGTGSSFFSYAIDSTDRTASFHIACDENNVPLDYFHSLQKLTHDDRIQHKKSVEVQCRSLNSLAQEGVISHQVGLLKTDTEGNDLHVLKGMSDIQAEVIVCEYFMPGIYGGWAEGHPEGLIETAKSLGFNHFVATKRMYEYEFITIDSPYFCEKQWGNLIFINDSLFERIKPELELYIAAREMPLYGAIQRYTEVLQSEIQLLRTACNDRLKLIQLLDASLRGYQRWFVLKNKIVNGLNFLWKRG